MTDNTRRPTAAHLSLRDRWKINRYLAKVGDGLPDLTTPTDFRRWDAIRSDLRAGILAAAADVGMDQALADLGPAEVLAREYDLAIRGPRAPQWTRGVIAAMVLLLALALVWSAYTTGVARGLLYAGGGDAPWVNVLGVSSRPFSDGETFGVNVNLTGLLWWFLAALIVFLLAAKVWRLWRRPATG